MLKTKIKKDKWIKLICCDCNEDIIAIEDLCAIYITAGVDYIDVPAEESIVHSAKKGIEWAKKVYKNSSGLIQWAGGTNEKTHEYFKSNNLPEGIAFGGASRKIMQPLIEFAHRNKKDSMIIPKKWL